MSLPTVCRKSYVRMKASPQGEGLENISAREYIDSLRGGAIINRPQVRCDQQQIKTALQLQCR